MSPSSSRMRNSLSCAASCFGARSITARRCSAAFSARPYLAEVFAKYGLAEKAAEHLRAVIERAPKQLAAHDKLFRILLDEGDIDAARAAANQYIGLLREKNDAAAIEGVRGEFLSRGHALAAAP